MFTKLYNITQKFYKQEEEAEFVEFISDSSDGADERLKESNKKKKQQDIDFVPLIAEQVLDEQQKIKINVNRNGDVIESIDIECECGQKTKIILEQE